MKPLQLYTAFHANLDFSAMPDADRAEVIERCYWPLLSLPEELGIRIGFELSGRTLELLESEDPDWVKRFVGLVECGAIEPIASGRAQIVAPLVPTEINRLNLKLGAEMYLRVLGAVPTTWFVSEQTWSDGLAPLFHEAGAERLIMEWNNPAAHRPELKPLRCQPARLRAGAGAHQGPAVLWNDSIVFQKMQRVAHGEVPAEDLLDYIEALGSRPNAQSLCLYGGDVEIFDYRPSRRRPQSEGTTPVEMTRLLEVFRIIAEDGRYSFALPREIAGPETDLPLVSLGSGPDPIPCKKQPRYNPTRWAVSGRDGFAMNTRCHDLLRSERSIRRLAKGPVAGSVSSNELVDLWRSDFRTRATEEKIENFESNMGLARARSRAQLSAVMPKLQEGEDLLLVQPGNRTWDRMPIEVPLRFPPGRHYGLDLSLRRGENLARDDYQFEVAGRYRDGSIREATLVLRPQLAAGAGLALAFTSRETEASRDPSRRSVRHEVSSAGTDCVEASFLSHRGAAIEGVRFPSLNASEWFGTLAHGTFDAIEFTPDFYSGHVVALSESREKVTDLRHSPLEVDHAASGPVRLTLTAQFDSPFGPWRKRYSLYRSIPRIDVQHLLTFHEARLASLRLGTVTLRPDAWDRDSLRYATMNGGAGVEWRGFAAGEAIRQSQAVSPSVSATSCLGATEGWVALADQRQGVVVSGDRSRAAVAPLLDFEDVDEAFFCRLAHSAAESDETRASFLRGRLDFRFAIEGFLAGDDTVIEGARNRHQGLVFRTEAGVGISSGL